MKKDYYVVLIAFRKHQDNYFVYGKHYGSALNTNDKVYLIDVDEQVNRATIIDIAIAHKGEKVKLLIKCEKPLTSVKGSVLTPIGDYSHIYDKPQVNQRLKGLMYEVNSEQPIKDAIPLLFKALNNAYLGTMLKIDKDGNKQTIVLTTKDKKSYFAVFTDSEELKLFPGEDRGDHLISIKLKDFWQPQNEEEENIGVIVNPYSSDCFLNLTPEMLKEIKEVFE